MFAFVFVPALVLCVLVFAIVFEFGLVLAYSDCLPLVACVCMCMHGCICVYCLQLRVPACTGVHLCHRNLFSSVLIALPSPLPLTGVLGYAPPHSALSRMIQSSISYVCMYMYKSSKKTVFT